MSFILRNSAVLLLTAILVGCTTVKSSDGVMKAETRTGGFMGLTTQDDIEVGYAKGFNSVEKVLIGGFKVGFNDSKKLTQKTSGMFRPSTSQTGLVKLEGVDQSTRQQITDDMYDHFVQALKDAGYQVVSRDELTRIPAYKEVKEDDFPYMDDSSGLFSSYGVGYFYSPKQIGPKQPFFPGELKNPDMFAGFSQMGMAKAPGEFAKVSDARIINVSYIVDFAGAGSGDFFSTALEVGQLMTIDSAILGISKGGTGVQTATTGQLTLGQPIASEIAFATIQDNTSEVEAGATMAVNAFAGYLRGGLTGALHQSASQTREYLFLADQEKYAEAAREVLSKTNTLLATKMASLR